ncbi:MAG: hypothetical protein ABFS23_01800 [Pseudomonadota bacterium]
MRFLTFVATAALFFLAASPSFAASKADFEKEYAAAEAAQKKAASVGGEWRDVGKFLKQANAAAKSGDYETAVKQATKARRHGELGHEQAVAQQGKDVTPSMVR